MFFRYLLQRNYSEKARWFDIVIVEGTIPLSEFKPWGSSLGYIYSMTFYSFILSPYYTMRLELRWVIKHKGICVGNTSCPFFFYYYFTKMLIKYFHNYFVNWGLVRSVFLVTVT